MTVSPDSLLRSIRRITLPQAAAPMVIGVDDWAIRRGQRNGTILCDLERHRPVELLPERSAESFKAWLLAHPGVQVISRDRGDDYRKGAAAGAPRATQVADRWHLMHNLHEALMRTAERLHREVDQAARAVAGALKTPPEKPSPASGSLAADPAIGKPSRAEQAKQIRQARRQERYEQVLKLHQQGLTRRAIAHQLDLARDTIRRWVRAGALPQRATRRYPHGTDAFVEHLRRRWQEGCHNAVTLTRELTSQGFGGSYYMVRRWVAMWRADDCDGNHSHTGRVPPDRPVFHRPSPKRVAWWLMKPASDLLDHEQALLTAVQERCPELKAAADLAREFADLLHKHQAQSLEAWIEKAHRPEAPVELRSFADGLKEDWAAVHAAFSLGWSNGQVEGQVNRLKLIKRQMYGRANFDLLRQRFLYAG